MDFQVGATYSTKGHHKGQKGHHKGGKFKGDKDHSHGHDGGQQPWYQKGQHAHGHEKGHWHQGQHDHQGHHKGFHHTPYSRDKGQIFDGHHSWNQEQDAGEGKSHHHHHHKGGGKHEKGKSWKSHHSWNNHNTTSNQEDGGQAGGQDQWNSTEGGHGAKDHYQKGGHHHKGYHAKQHYQHGGGYQPHQTASYHHDGAAGGVGGVPYEHRQKKRYFRRCVDYNSTVVNFLETWNEGENIKRTLGCNYTFAKDMMPAFATPYSPYDAICSRYVYSAVNKVRSAVNTVTFSPNGRRVITGSHTGELTIWNAQQFHFENNMQAHTAAVRALTWSPVEDILLSGDHLGQIKLWDQHFYNSQNLQAHKDSLREISMAPTGQKFCTCADDSSAKVWDFKTLQEERQFAGHGWDVKCCSWHPSKGLVATGSKDCQIKLWDPRASDAVTTIHAHKNMVTRVKWSSEGNWLISGGRDTTIGLMDIRTMTVRKHFKGHSREVTALCWHPEFESIFCSGGFDGSLIYWDLGQDKPLENIQQAHDATIWSIAWHPFGHLVASGSHDNCCRFWSRCRPGDRNIKDLVPKREHRFGFDKTREETKNKHAEEEAELGELPKPTCLPDKILKCGIFASLDDEPAKKKAKLEQEEEQEQARVEEGKTSGDDGDAKKAAAAAADTSVGPPEDKSTNQEFTTPAAAADDDAAPQFVPPSVYVADPPNLYVPDYDASTNDYLA